MRFILIFFAITHFRYGLASGVDHRRRRAAAGGMGWGGASPPPTACGRLPRVRPAGRFQGSSRSLVDNMGRCSSLFTQIHFATQKRRGRSQLSRSCWRRGKFVPSISFLPFRILFSILFRRDTASAALWIVFVLFPITAKPPTHSRRFSRLTRGSWPANLPLLRSLCTGVLFDSNSTPVCSLLRLPSAACSSA